MGLLNAILGDASEEDAKELQADLEAILASGETVEKAYRFVRDLMIFTERRLILIDKQGLTGRRTEYLSIPYRAIQRFSVITAGHFDLDSELSLWVGADPTPVTKTVRGRDCVISLQQLLASHI